MKPNVGTIDKSVRFLAAAAVAVLYFSGVLSGTAAGVLGVVAIVLAITGTVSFCPAYKLLGISTKKHEETSDHAGEA